MGLRVALHNAEATDGECLGVFEPGGAWHKPAVGETIWLAKDDGGIWAWEVVSIEHFYDKVWTDNSAVISINLKRVR